MWSTLASPQPFEAERRAWLAQAEADVSKRRGKSTFSAHSLLLFVDVELAFCSGAWLAVIVISHAIVEAFIRQVSTNDYRSSSVKLVGSNTELEWLRGIRNEVLHAAEPGTPSQIWKVSSGDIPLSQQALEAEAKRAITLAYKEAHARSGT